jgi:hypothetical protein
MYITVALRGKRKKECKNYGVDNLKPWAHRPNQAQSHKPALEACTSHRCSKMRPAVIKTSQANFRSWGMSQMGSLPRSTRALEIPMTGCDSCSASTECSPLIPSTRAGVSSSSADRSCLSGRCRTHTCSSASIASCTSRSISCRQRHSSNVWLRLMSKQRSPAR